jgi:hypothetical protein
VCSHLGLDKATLENYAISLVKDTLMDPRFVRGIEEELKRLMLEAPQNGVVEAERIGKLVEDNKLKIRNLTDALERGVITASVYDRLNELEPKGRSWISSLTL